jgi:hypothetical protein
MENIDHGIRKLRLESIQFIIYWNPENCKVEKMSTGHFFKFYVLRGRRIKGLKRRPFMNSWLTFGGLALKGSDRQQFALSRSLGRTAISFCEKVESKFAGIPRYFLLFSVILHGCL